MIKNDVRKVAKKTKKRALREVLKEAWKGIIRTYRTKEQRKVAEDAYWMGVLPKKKGVHRRHWAHEFKSHA